MSIIRSLFGNVVTDEVYTNSVYIYLMTTNNGKYKIGYSGQPKDRLQTIKAKMKGVCVELSHTFHADDMNSAELKLHNRYSHLRLSKRSEWFNLTNADVADIRSIVKYEDGEFIQNEN